MSVEFIGDQVARDRWAILDVIANAERAYWDMANAMERVRLTMGEAALLEVQRLSRETPLSLGESLREVTRRWEIGPPPRPPKSPGLHVTREEVDRALRRAALDKRTAQA